MLGSVGRDTHPGLSMVSEIFGMIPSWVQVWDRDWGGDFLVQVKSVKNRYRLIRTERILEETSWSTDYDGSHKASFWKDNID